MPWHVMVRPGPPRKQINRPGPPRKQIKELCCKKDPFPSFLFPLCSMKQQRLALRFQEEEEMGGSVSKQEGSEQQSWNSIARKAVCVAGAVATGAALLWGLSSVGAADDKLGKLMKAPGRIGELIEREKFAGDPKTYFRDLRGKKK